MTQEQANIALQQLTANEQRPTGALKLMIGAKNFSFGESGVSFIFKMFRKANVCRIELNESTDLYNLVFSKIARYELKEVLRFDGLYCDQLKEVFERETGLTLTVPRIFAGGN